MLNSVKAFLIGKQKACKIVKTTEKVDILVERDEEKEQAELKRQSELYEIMISMAEAKLDINDIKTFIVEERKQRDARSEEERKVLRNGNKNKSNGVSLRLSSRPREPITSTKQDTPNKSIADTQLRPNQDNRDKRTTSPMFMGRDTRTNWAVNDSKNNSNHDTSKKDLLEIGGGNQSIKSQQPRAKSSNGIKRDNNINKYQDLKINGNNEEVK